MFAVKFRTGSTAFGGASTKELIVTGSTTVNLHKLIARFFDPKKEKNKILADELNFPSDIYAIKSQLHLKGLSSDTHLQKVHTRDGHTLNIEDIIEAMTEDVALIN